MADGWTSLEIAKFAVSVCVPLSVVGLGLLVNRSVKRIEQAQWGNRKLVELRLELYGTMAEPLNDLYCCFLCVGDYKSVPPPDVVRRKRTLDKLFHVNEHLMSDRFREHYHSFIDSCFATHRAAATAAKLRAAITDQRNERSPWDDEWDVCFVADQRLVTPRDEVARRYRQLVKTFRDDIGLSQTPR